MFASAAGANTSNDRVIPLSPINHQPIGTSLEAMLRQLDAAHGSGDLDRAETLIAAIYARTDAVRMANTRDGGTR